MRTPSSEYQHYSPRFLIVSANFQAIGKLLLQQQSESSGQLEAERIALLSFSKFSFICLNVSVVNHTDLVPNPGYTSRCNQCMRVNVQLGHVCITLAKQITALPVAGTRVPGRCPLPPVEVGDQLSSIPSRSSEPPCSSPPLAGFVSGRLFSVHAPPQVLKSCAFQFGLSERIIQVIQFIWGALLSAGGNPICLHGLLYPLGTLAARLAGFLESSCVTLIWQVTDGCYSISVFCHCLTFSTCCRGMISFRHSPGETPADMGLLISNCKVVRQPCFFLLCFQKGQIIRSCTGMDS